MNFNDLYKNKTVLVTGHTGFKGSWLTTWLNHLGANVIGLSNEVPTEPSNFVVSNVQNFCDDNRFDILELTKVCELISNIKPDFVFHLAAQPLVRHSYEKPLETLLVNSIGSANILEALRLSEKSITAIMITSDKAYDNVEWIWGYKETDRLGGKDPYSGSKGMAELAIKSYFESYFNSTDSNIKLGVARAGNVIGGGDWAMDRIVPDCMIASSNNKSVDIRSPNATRPWQHVLEPLSGYLLLGMELYQSQKLNGSAYNFGPPANQNHSVKDLIELMAENWNQISWNDISSSNSDLHEAGLLKLNCDKALSELEWIPTLNFHETVKMTVDWYKKYYEDVSHDMQEYTTFQIDEYMALANKRKLIWTK
tara:strand:- start:344 stop:1444 length:1101 start_codon:yes stop_codon:yes gene_type:complete